MLTLLKVLKKKLIECRSKNRVNDNDFPAKLVLAVGRTSCLLIATIILLQDCSLKKFDLYGLGESASPPTPFEPPYRRGRRDSFVCEQQTLRLVHNVVLIIV